MASIWKHPNSKFWTACFRNGNGEQRRVSTKTTNRRLARRIADEYEKAVRNKRSFFQLERVLKAFHAELCGESVEARSLRAFCEEWLTEKLPSVSASTAKFYRATVQKLYAYFGSRTDEPIEAITRADLVEFRNKLSSELSASTVNHDLIAVRMIFNDARRQKRISENPAEDIKPVREFDDPAETPRRAFTLSELQALLAVADPEWQSMIRIGLYSGGRLGDIATLRWCNVDLVREELRFTARKTGKTALIPIVGALKSHLLSLPSADDPRAPLHPRAAGIVERRGNSAGLSAAFGELLELAGLRPVKRRGNVESGTRRHRFNALSFHSLRHTTVSLLKDAGMPQATVQALVGHSSAAMSEIYTHVGQESLARAAASLPEL